MKTTDTPSIEKTIEQLEFTNTTSRRKLTSTIATLENSLSVSTKAVHELLGI